MEIERSQDPNTVKVIFVGESSTGKTSLINNIFHIEINPSQPSTCIPNQHVYHLQMPSSQEVLLSIWDTAGQEKFRSLNKLFFKDAKIAIIVIDITQKKTFEALDEFWYSYIREICGEHCVIGIAENKVDLFEKEQVTENEVKEYIKDKDIISNKTLNGKHNLRYGTNNNNGSSSSNNTAVSLSLSKKKLFFLFFLLKLFFYFTPT